MNIGEERDAAQKHASFFQDPADFAQKILFIGYML